MRLLKTILAVLVVVTILAVFYNFALNRIDPTLYFDPKQTGDAVRDLPIARTLGAAVAMIIGITFGALYDELHTRQNIDSYRQELARLFRSTRFLRALLAAPIVFVGV